MLLTGIWKLSQFEAHARGGQVKKPIAYSLLRHASEGPVGRALFECVIRDLQLSSGVVRTTYANRFTDVNELVLAVLKRDYTPAYPIEAHDWAASDCLASYEFATVLFEAFPRSTLTASDISFQLICARNTSTQEEFVFEDNGRALQYVKPPFVLPLARPAPRFRVVNQILRRRAIGRARKVACVVRPWLKECPESISTGEWEISRVSLIHPVALAALAREPRFRTAIHSVFSPLSAEVDLIRTMNIFNRCYFSDEEIARGAAAVFRSLRPGGLWIAGRTTEERRVVQNCVTVYCKDPGRFRQVAELNGGCDIADIVAALDPAGLAAAGQMAGRKL